MPEPEPWSLEGFLRSPYLSWITCLVTTAVAISGKLDLNVSRVLLFLAWLLTIFSIYRVGPIMRQRLGMRIFWFIVASCTIGFLFYHLSRWMSDKNADKAPPQNLHQPLITMAPLKDENGHYVTIIESPDSVRVELTFEIKNSGDVETEAIPISGESATVDPSTQKTKVIPARILSDKIALAPGQRVGVKTISIHSDQTPEQKAALLSGIRSATLIPESPQGVYTTELSVEYFSPRGTKKKFRTEAVFKQTYNEAMIISQSYIGSSSRSN